jgi:signal transduction histidine kinase
MRLRLPQVRDLLAVTVGLIAAADSVVAALDEGSVLTAFGAGAVSVFAAIALWWRRRQPELVSIIGIAVTFVTGAPWVMLLAIASLVVRRRDRVTFALAATATVAMVAGPRLTPLNSESSPLSIGEDVVSALLTIGLVVALAAFVGARRDLITSLEGRIERAEAERELREAQGRLNERNRIAREMHDVLAHKVSLIALQAGGLEVTHDPSAKQVSETAALIRQTARQALEDLRDVLGVLHQDSDSRAKLAPQASLADITSLIEASRQAGLQIRLMGTADLSKPTTDLVSRAAYRLVQEALTNVHKHARNATTTVCVDGAPGTTLEIDVVNLPPVGADHLLPGSGLGLIGLRERVESAGGAFEAGPTAQAGFRVHASLPWPAEALVERPEAHVER